MRLLSSKNLIFKRFVVILYCFNRFLTLLLISRLKNRLSDLTAKLNGLLSKVSLVDVVREYVKVVPRGGEKYNAHCPFHKDGQEKNPSMSIDNGKGLYYCFTCNAKGNVITFLREKGGMNFKESVQFLGKRFNVDVSNFFSRHKNADVREPIIAANATATRVFGKYLLSKNAIGYAYPAAVRYLIKRNVPLSIVRQFKLGYAPPRWNGLCLAMRQLGYKDDVLLSSGLAKEKNGKPFDRFIDRIIFPIINEHNEIIGFGGRCMDGREPKYLNSPETPVFSKKRTLYGIHLAKDAIKAKNEALLLEGYMDVIAAHKAGITHAVGTLGTAFTAYHMNVLKKYTNTIVLGFDNDAAGLKAVLAAITIGTQEHADIGFRNSDNRSRDVNAFEIHVFTLAGAKDIDEYLTTHSRESFDELYSKKKIWYDFLLDKLIAERGGETAEAKRAVAYEMFSFVKLLQHQPILRNAIIKHITERLSLGDERSVRSEFDMFEKGQPAPAPVPVEKKARAASLGNGGEERELLLLLAFNPDRIADTAGKIAPERFSNDTYREIYLRLLSLEGRTGLTVEDVAQAVAHAPFARKLASTTERKIYHEDSSAKIAECITAFERRNLQAQEHILKERMQSGSINPSQNPDAAIAQVLEKIRINKEKAGIR